MIMAKIDNYAVSELLIHWSSLLSDLSCQCGSQHNLNTLNHPCFFIELAFYQVL